MNINGITADTIRPRGREHVRLGQRHIFRQLPQHGQIAEDPKRSALGGNNQIVILDDERYEEEELSKANELAILDEDKASLVMRIERLDTGMAWAEDPPSRTRHLITNIEVEAGETAEELQVYSNFMVYRNRGETEQDFFVGQRDDMLRKIDGAWKIARRKIILDQNTLLAKNVSIFF